MVKNYFLGFCMLFGVVSQAQIINFPDANFKNALINNLCVDTNNNGSGDADTDTNNDGQIDVNEAAAVIGLYVNDAGISDLSGIANFVNMTTLSCNYNSLTFFSGAGLQNLLSLDCSHNQITDGTFNLMSNLQSISISYNLITELDLSSTRATNIICSFNPNLVFMNMKNGVISTCLMLLMMPPCVDYMNSALTHICVDEEELALMAGGNNTSFINTYCPLSPNPNFNIISGSAQYNCGGTAVPLASLPVNINSSMGSITVLTNGLGFFNRYVGTGTFTIVPSMQNLPYFTVSPPSVSTTFAATGDAYNTDFCLTAVGVHPDLEVTLIPVSRARAGFDATYKVLIKNVGTQTQSGSATVTFNDNVADFVSAIPAVTSQAANTLVWDFTAIAPFQTREYLLVLNLNAPIDTPPLNSGDILDFTAQLTTSLIDETPANNVFTMRQTVVNSFDPNDKTCLEGTQIALSDVTKDLHYVVRFQNTGTADAINIVVSDIIQNNLNVATLQIESASHPYRATVFNNQLSVYFDNINLPASIVNEPASHGYVAFKIKPKNTVGLNDVISNTANIYFDFNFPIVTNTTSTTVVNLGTPSFTTGSLFSIYPNPTHDILNITLANANGILKRISIYNTLGQLLLTTNNTTSLDTSALSQGMYFIMVETDKGKDTQQFLKK
ncbi:DUF7619 domain-containing protein [Flavobacterium sp. RSB2_4_14]|uniref:T9SS type A sorting domain-containing protein n=1 Tax=Flavobacterium sp. RSB2_4_14 TaxID=3447665 RepID=UPI003F31E692